jgi:hypothetical protein
MQELDIVRELAMKYARNVDDRDFEAMRDIMAPDFTQRGPGFASESLDEFIAALAVLEQFSATFHLVGNQLGEWRDEIYTGETWCVASHLYERDGVARKDDMGIRYQDKIARVDGRFVYTRRDLRVVWRQDLPLQG